MLKGSMDDAALPTPGVRASTSRTRAFPLAATLLLRACVNGGFAIWLLSRPLAWTDFFWAGSWYALGDGALGLVTVVLLWRHRPITAPPLLVSMVLADAVLRVAAAVVVRMFAGIPYFPITLVLFFGALGTWAAIAGVAAMGAWIVAHEHHHDARLRQPSRVHALFDPLTLAGVIALVFVVYAFVVGPPSTADALRETAAVACAALALVFLAAAIGVVWRRRPRGDRQARSQP